MQVMGMQLLEIRNREISEAETEREEREVRETDKSQIIQDSVVTEVGLTFYSRIKGSY